jgi:acyl dehydratase
LDELTVGQRFASGAYRVDAKQIIAHAREFNPQPFHLDDAAARETIFGGLAASGMHTAAITIRLLVEGGPRLAGGIIASGCEIRWPRPTRPGDVLQVKSEVLEIEPSRSRADRGFATLRSDTYNQHGEIVQTFKIKLLAPRQRSSSSAERQTPAE